MDFVLDSAAVANDELLRQVISQVLEEVQGETRTTPRGAQLPVLPEGTQPTLDYCAMCVEQEQQRGRKRAVLTTTGKNRKGIVAKMTQVIAEAGGDILDISQTLVSDYFTMIIIVDTGALSVPFAEFKARLERTVAGAGAECLVMHEEIVNALQRV